MNRNFWLVKNELIYEKKHFQNPFRTPNSNGQIKSDRLPTQHKKKIEELEKRIVFLFQTKLKGQKQEIGSSIVSPKRNKCAISKQYQNLEQKKKKVQIPPGRWKKFRPTAPDQRQKRWSVINPGGTSSSQQHWRPFTEQILSSFWKAI